jgi:hypothetical protein
MDPVSLIAIITSVSALVVSILSHIRRSDCYGIHIETKESNQEVEKIKELRN